MAKISPDDYIHNGMYKGRQAFIRTTPHDYSIFETPLHESGPLHAILARRIKYILDSTPHVKNVKIILADDTVLIQGDIKDKGRK